MNDYHVLHLIFCQRNLHSIEKIKNSKREQADLFGWETLAFLASVGPIIARHSETALIFSITITSTCPLKTNSTLITQVTVQMTVTIHSNKNQIGGKKE